MKIGFYSQLLHYKRWKKPPLWTTQDGSLVEICVAFPPAWHEDPRWKNFVSHNMRAYPDGIYYNLDKRVRSGIQKPDFIFENQN